MALTATLFQFNVQLNDSDREVYESFELRVACHPSETPAFMLTRVLAYCLEYREGICFTGGVSSGELCAVQVIDMTGRVTHWIEVGAPSAERLHRGSKLAGRAVVYTHQSPAKVLGALRGQPIHAAEDIEVVSFGGGFVESLITMLSRRNELSVAVSGGQLYLEFNGQVADTSLQREPIGRD